MDSLGSTTVGTDLPPEWPAVELELIGTKYISKPGGPLHICPPCDLPMLQYGRLNGCNHAVCSSCAESSNKCFICQVPIKGIQRLDDVESLYVCRFLGCNRSYTNDYSLNEHQKLRKHYPPAEPLPLRIAPDEKKRPAAATAAPAISTLAASTSAAAPAVATEDVNAIYGSVSLATAPAAVSSTVSPVAAMPAPFVPSAAALGAPARGPPIAAPPPPPPQQQQQQYARASTAYVQQQQQAHMPMQPPQQQMQMQRRDGPDDRQRRYGDERSMMRGGPPPAAAGPILYVPHGATMEHPPMQQVYAPGAYGYVEGGMPLSGFVAQAPHHQQQQDYHMVAHYAPPQPQHGSPPRSGQTDSHYDQQHQQQQHRYVDPRRERKDYEREREWGQQTYGGRGDPRRPPQYDDRRTGPR